MVRAPAGQAHRAQRAQSPPAAYRSFVDPGHAGDQPGVLRLLSGILQAPTDYAVFATDPHGEILLWTEGAARLFGQEPHAVLGKLTFGDLYATAAEQGPPPGQAAPAQAAPAGAAAEAAAGQAGPEAAAVEAGPEAAAGDGPLATARRDGVWRGTFRRQRADGERFTVRAIVTPLGGADQPAGYVVLSWDASAEMSRVERLERAVLDARSLFEANTVPLITTDPLGVITDVNHPAELLAGRTRDQLRGTPVTEHVTQPEQFRDVIRAVLRDGRVTGPDLTVRRPDGSVADVRASASTFTDAGGTLEGILATLYDMTEERRLHDDLGRSEAYYRRLIEAAADGVAVVDAHGFLTDVNQRWCTMCGSSRAELIGSAFTNCFTDPAEAGRAVARTFAEDLISDCELGIDIGGGAITRVSVNAARCAGPGDEAERIVASIRDVTKLATLRDRAAAERAYNRNVIESSANGLLITDLRHRVRDVNTALCGLAGRSRDQLIGSEAPSCFADPDAAADLISRALAQGEITHRELCLADADQTSVAVNATVLRDAAGETAGALLSVRDVSEEIRLRRDLAARQAYTRMVIEAAVAAVFTVARDGLVADVNAAASALTGFPRGLLLGRPFSELFGEPDAARQTVSRAFRDGRVVAAVLRLTTADSSPRIVTCDAGRFLDPRDGQQALVVSVRDITAQRETEERLYFYNQSLYAATTDAIVITDVIGTISDANQRMERLAGQSRDELTGTSLDGYFTEPKQARNFLRAVLREGKVADFELSPGRPGGPASTVLSFSAWTFADSHGKLQGILASARDVTERKKFEGIQAGMLDRARELDRAKSDFVARVSHELRSPLTSILGYLELLGEDDDDSLTARQQRMVEVINRNCQRLISLIEDLLLLSRIEAGTLTLDCEHMDPGKLIERVHESFQPAIREQRLASRLDCEPDLGLVADPVQLERLMTNLISNAVKFTPPEGKIDISCRRDRDSVLITVRDTGIGVPEAEQSRLFSRFFRSSVSLERETQGTGLGLFIVKRIAEAHGGTVAAESSVGEGSTFTVRLPADRRDPRGRQ